MPKEKTAEQKIKFAETGLIRLDIKVPGLTPENAQLIARDVRFALETCGRLLDEFTATLRVEYTEILGEGGRIDERQ